MITYGDPPRTKGMHPDDWPTARELTDQHLLRRLTSTELRDAWHRRWFTVHQYRLCSECHARAEKDRKGIDRIHADLYQEAVRRGFRDPWRQGPNERPRVPLSTPPINHLGRDHCCFRGRGRGMYKTRPIPR